MTRMIITTALTIIDLQPESQKHNTMTAIKSTIDPSLTLLTYKSGVQYIVYGYAAWLVRATFDDTGSFLKRKYFPETEGKGEK